MHNEPLLRHVVKSLPGFDLLWAGRGHLRPIGDWLFGASTEHWARVIMDRETRPLIEKLDPSRCDALEISGERWRQIGFNTYKSVHYPDYDICEAALAERFDVIIAEQVFEHLLWPYRAGKNVYQMLNRGGSFLVTTPFLIRIHNHPIDCSRWTEVGMKHFLAECGFPLNNIQTGSWGNRACVRANYSAWARYRPRLHSLHNEPNFPVVVWAVAQK